LSTGYWFGKRAISIKFFNTFTPTSKKLVPKASRIRRKPINQVLILLQNLNGKSGLGKENEGVQAENSGKLQRKRNNNQFKSGRDREEEKEKVTKIV